MPGQLSIAYDSRAGLINTRASAFDIPSAHGHRPRIPVPQWPTARIACNPGELYYDRFGDPIWGRVKDRPGMQMFYGPEGRYVVPEPGLPVQPRGRVVPGVQVVGPPGVAVPPVAEDLVGPTEVPMRLPAKPYAIVGPTERPRLGRPAVISAGLLALAAVLGGG